MGSAVRSELTAMRRSGTPASRISSRACSAAVVLANMPATVSLAMDNYAFFMALIVQKFGGTSVGSTERIRNVARRIAKWKAAGHALVVVPSAMAGETNRLIELARQMQAQRDAPALDVVAATGRQVALGLLAMALLELGVKARSYTGWQVQILTDSTYSRARIISIDESKLRADLAEGCVAIVAGFQGVDGKNNLTTLGRGGSDTSA